MSEADVVGLLIVALDGEPGAVVVKALVVGWLTANLFDDPLLLDVLGVVGYATVGEDLLEISVGPMITQAVYQVALWDVEDGRHNSLKRAGGDEGHAGKCIRREMECFKDGHSLRDINIQHNTSTDRTDRGVVAPPYFDAFGSTEAKSGTSSSSGSAEVTTTARSAAL